MAPNLHPDTLVSPAQLVVWVLACALCVLIGVFWVGR
jgi:hypothetical protein